MNAAVTQMREFAVTACSVKKNCILVLLRTQFARKKNMSFSFVKEGLFAGRWNMLWEFVEQVERVCPNSRRSSWSTELSMTECGHAKCKAGQRLGKTTWIFFLSKSEIL